MKKIMLIASAMSALSLPFSAGAIELGDEGGLECGPYAKVGVVGGMITGVESARLDPADVNGKKHLSLTTGLPFGGTLAAGMTIAPGFRAELGFMYLMNVKAELESGKTGSDTRTDTDFPMPSRYKLTPPQPTIMPISIADRNFGVDIPNMTRADAAQQNIQVDDVVRRGAARIAWLKQYAGIDYLVRDHNGNMAINPVLAAIPRGNPNPPAPGQQRVGQPADCDLLDHEQWRCIVTGVTAMSNANKPSVSPVKVLSDKIVQIYRDMKPFARVAGIEVPSDPLPNSASIEQIQNKMQELNDILDDIRDSFDGCIGGNAFAHRIQLNFRIPQAQQQGQGQQQQQAQATEQEVAAAAAVRVLNNNTQIIQLYKDLVKLKRHAGIKKAMKELAAQDGGGDNKKRGASEDSDSCGGSKEGKGKETEFDLSMIVGQVKLYADLFTTESFSIYAGLGAGLAYTSGKIDGVDIKASTGMVASGALGVAINAAEGVYVDIEGGYMHSFSKIEEKYSVNALMANVGVRYNF
uniref:56 kDa type-specific antigen n=1 Tax=Orientia tsutsugamushi TaxID=784 RepID=E5D3I5_ORITS|nr:56-kDa type-specific antigen [Orientia tsutsugamushi]